MAEFNTTELAYFFLSPPPSFSYTCVRSAQINIVVIYNRKYFISSWVTLYITFSENSRCRISIDFASNATQVG